MKIQFQILDSLKKRRSSLKCIKTNARRKINIIGLPLKIVIPFTPIVETLFV